jgi:SAM-dependent methyltransferase
MDVSSFFDQVYRQFARYWWTEPERYSTDPADHPTSLITQQLLRLLARRPPGRALDLGAGEGADAIRLALMGYDVDAVEISSVAATKMRRFADEAGVRLRIWNTDVAGFAPTGPYDVVVCNGLLHYIADKPAVVRRMQNATIAGGLNAVSLWSTFTPVPEAHRVAPVYCEDEDGVLIRLYAGWRHELLYFERNKLEKSHRDLEPHRHSYIKLIAHKPSTGNTSRRHPSGCL